MSTGEESVGTEALAAPSAETRSERVRASSTTLRAPVASDPHERAITTAEIPIATHNTAAPTASSRYADPARRRGGRHRDSAPVTLRAGVWVLFFIFLFSLAGLVTVRVHPTWLSFLRATTTPVAAPPSSTTSTVAPSGLTFQSQSGKTFDYAVGAASYDLVVVTGPNPSWTVVNAGSVPRQPFLYAHTIPANTTVDTGTQSGSATLSTTASGVQLIVKSGSTVVGRIKSLTGTGFYTFTPSASA